MAPRDTRAPFERVSDDLRMRIQGGDLVPGDRLPSGRELAETYGIALATAQSALKRLRDEGLATSSPRGYFVAGATPDDEGEALRAQLSRTRAELAALTRRVELLEQSNGQ